MKTIVLFIVVLIATNCGTQKQMDNLETSERNQDNTILGVWNIISINGEMLKSNAAKITFEDEQQVIATIGCNIHRGNFTVKETTLKINQLISTEKYCPDLDKLETLLRKELTAITHYKLDTNELLLLTNDKTSIVLSRNDR